MFPKSRSHITMDLEDKGRTAFDEPSNRSMADRNYWKLLNIKDGANESRRPVHVAHSRIDETQCKKARKDKLQPEAGINYVLPVCACAFTHESMNLQIAQSSYLAVGKGMWREDLNVSLSYFCIVWILSTGILVVFLIGHNNEIYIQPGIPPDTADLQWVELPTLLSTTEETRNMAQMFIRVPGLEGFTME